MADLDDSLNPLEKLTALLEWALRVRLDGGIPFLPSTSAHVREMLMRNLKYIARIFKLNNQIEGLVVAAQKNGELSALLPTNVILFSYYARTCDPTVEYLQIFSKMSKDEIVSNMLHVTFSGFKPE